MPWSASKLISWQHWRGIGHGISVVATLVMAVFTIKLFGVSSQLAQLAELDFISRNTSQLRMTDWTFNMDGPKRFGYHVKVEEMVGAATRVKKAEVYLSRNVPLDPNGLYRCMLSRPGDEIHRDGDHYWIANPDISVSYDESTVETVSLYMYVWLTHEDINTGRTRTRFDAIEIRITSGSEISGRSFVKPEPHLIRALLDAHASRITCTSRRTDWP